jgi:hypothetical protein
VYLSMTVWQQQPGQRRARLQGLLILLAGAAVLAFAAAHQVGDGEPQRFLATLAPLQEKLQRLRASYVWISLWGATYLPYYLGAGVVLAAACARIWRRAPVDLRWFLVGLPAAGVVSVPLSWLLLEQAHLALIPQWQPLRALLFVVLMLQFAAAVAGVFAAQARRIVESAAWFAVAVLPALAPRWDVPWPWTRVAVLVLLAALAAMALWFRSHQSRLAPAWIALAALSGFAVVPGVVMANHGRFRTLELDQLSAWARAATPPDSVFLFADAGRNQAPGVFRAEALRAVYVDWKGGGQVNYLREFGEQWWFRWQQTAGTGFRPEDLPKYNALGIQYVVLARSHRLATGAPAFENARYVVYSVR